MPKNPTKKSLTRHLDKRCSELVRSRDVCARCQKNEQLETAHIFSRVYRSLRWDLENLICLCKSCHFWAHRNPVLFAEFVKTYMGRYKYNRLKFKAQSIKKWNLDEMVELLESLK